jgi:large subunit ribosomal protein L13
MSSPKFSKPLWHLVDARNQVVGRLATQIVHILKGKHKPTFTPNYDCGDYVVVVNAKDIKLTGKKVENKLYSWHTGYPGGIKHINAKTQLEQKPEEVLGIYRKQALEA